jgi:hypothetical protein
VSPGLIERVRQASTDSDFVILFSLRYHTAFHGARAAAARAVLVPTTERDPALGLEMFGPVLRGVRAIMYNSPEERALIETLHGNRGCRASPWAWARRSPKTDPARAAAAFGLDRPYVLRRAHRRQQRLCRAVRLLHAVCRPLGSSARPVLIGTAVLPIPEHPRIRHLGYVSDQDK